jgi:hypothetical protein
MVLAWLCFVRISAETATFAVCIINWLVFITAVESIYNAVRTDSLCTEKVKNKSNFYHFFSKRLLVQKLWTAKTARLIGSTTFISGTSIYSVAYFSTNEVEGA